MVVQGHIHFQRQGWDLNFSLIGSHYPAQTLSVYISQSMKSGQWDAFQSGAYELTCEKVSNTKLPPAILVPPGSKEPCAARQKRGSSQRVLGTVSTHSDRRMCSPQPRALGDPQAERQCKGRMARRDWNLRVNCRDGDWEDPFLVRAS